MKRALLVVAIAGVALDGGRSSRASVVDWFAGDGAALPAYRHEPAGRERPRTLEVNGVHIAVAAGRTSDDPAAVRGFYDGELRDGRHGRGEPLGFGDDERGAIGGIDLGGEPAAAELGARLGKLLRTGDLGALGQLQMVMYERGVEGGTSYLDLWTRDGLAIDRLLPPDGDVAGGELDRVPRPDGGRRVLAAGEAGRGERLRVYRVAGASLVALREEYLAELHARGWAIDARFAALAGARGRNQVRLVRGERDLHVDFTRSDDDVDVVVIELGR